ncbi:MAG: hypothetical protein ABIL39_11970, partial [candidate division WOR-3 bacterium]
EKITEKEYPADEDAGLIKSAYMIDPLKNYKTFAGIECRNAEEIGDAIEQESSYYKVYLKNKKNADLYLYLEARGYEDIANAFRKYAQAFNQERAFNTIVLELQGKEKFKFGNLIFFKPEDLLATEGEVKDKLIKELTNPDSKLSIWLEQFTELKNSIERWRKIGRYDATTLSYALDRESSFIINGEKARDVKEFESLLSKHILDIQKDIVPDSIFVKEADYWLHNYYNFKFATCLINTIGSNITKEFASDDMRKVYEWLCEVWIEYARAQFNRILRNEFVKLLKKINQNHQYLKFHAKEEQLIEELIKIEQTKLENTRKKELEKIEGDKKKELELLRNNYKQIQMQKFWEGEGKKIIFVGLSMTVAWTLFFAVKGGGVLIWIGAIIGGIAGLIYGGLFGAIIGLVVGGVVGVILPFVITPVFLYLLIRTLLSYHHINREASEILLPAATQKNYQDRIDKVQSEIEDKRKNIEQQIVNKVFKMDSIEINKELQSLTTTTNSKQV